MKSTVRQLLECFVATNDPDAFRALVELHGPMVLAVCRNVLRGQHDVEDAFQDTFLALAKGCAHNQAQRAPPPVAPPSRHPQGTEGTVQQTLRDRLSRRVVDSYSGPLEATS